MLEQVIMNAIHRGIVVHGGAGSPPAFAEGCELAASAGYQKLAASGNDLNASITAVVAMEDDGRFNAGSGSVLRLDGKSMEMDAAVMDSTGLLGAVACITAVKNPVLVARRVADTPHVLLCSEGAVAFARRCAFAEYRHVSERARARHLAVVEAIKRRDFGDFPPAWADFDLERYWNLDAPYRELFQPGDTVGAVSMSEDGVFAVAASTGGSSPMLRGRVGDTPIIGSGFYAGRHGAVATTGIGEEIVRRMLAREVYQLLADGEAPQEACLAAVASFPDDLSVGVIAIAPGGFGIASSVPMASHAVVE